MSGDLTTPMLSEAARDVATAIRALLATRAQREGDGYRATIIIERHPYRSGGEVEATVAVVPSLESLEETRAHLRLVLAAVLSGVDDSTATIEAYATKAKGVAH